MFAQTRPFLGHPATTIQASCVNKTGSGQSEFLTNHYDDCSHFIDSAFSEKAAAAGLFLPAAADRNDQDFLLHLRSLEEGEVI